VFFPFPCSPGFCAPERITLVYLFSPSSTAGEELPLPWPPIFLRRYCGDFYDEGLSLTASFFFDPAARNQVFYSVILSLSPPQTTHLAGDTPTPFLGFPTDVHMSELRQACPSFKAPFPLLSPPFSSTLLNHSVILESAPRCNCDPPHRKCLDTPSPSRTHAPEPLTSTVPPPLPSPSVPRFQDLKSPAFFSEDGHFFRFPSNPTSDEA